MSPPSEQELGDKQAQRLRLRLTLLRNSLSNLRSELTMERELLRLEKLEASSTELTRGAQPPDQPVARGLRDERSQLALQRQQSVIWFRQKLGEVDRQCSQEMEKVQRHIEPLRNIMSSLDIFAGDQCLDSSTSQASFLPIDDWTGDCNVQRERPQEVYDNGVWVREDRDMNGYSRGRFLEGDNHSKGWHLQGDNMWKSGENQKRPRGPNDWLDDEVSLAPRFMSCHDPDGITLLSRNSSNSLWAQYD